MAKPDNELLLQEEVLLLALRDDEGSIPMGTMCQYAIGGAILAELLLSGRIVLRKAGRKKLVEVASTTTLRAPVLDQYLQIIAGSPRTRPLTTWITNIGGSKELLHRVAAGLVKRGILRADQKKILGIFRRRVYPEVNHEPERQLIQRLKDAVKSGVAQLDTRTVVLISIAQHSGLLRFVFDKAELKQFKTRIKQIVDGELVGTAVKEVIESVEAAITMAAMIPVFTAASAS